MSKYNGWTNYETWNVSLWINNDESLYNIAKTCRDYPEFADKLKSYGELQTPDNVLYGDMLRGYGVLNLDELDEVIAEIHEN